MNGLFLVKVREGTRAQRKFDSKQDFVQATKDVTFSLWGDFVQHRHQALHVHDVI